MQLSSWKWKIGNLPFYYAPVKKMKDNCFPSAMPFELQFDLETGILKQAPDPKVIDALEKAYSKGSVITGIMDEKGIGKKYADDFMDFLSREMNCDFKHKRILEIGCGNGFLLYSLKKLGGSVLGVEPGPHGQVGAKKYDIDVIYDFFSSKNIEGKFDIIILYCVLEHIEGLEKFLCQVKKKLSLDGKIFFAVPDCETYIINGDLSMLLHEHFSYFTKDTFRSIIRKFLKMTADVEKSKYGGLLYASVSEKENTENESKLCKNGYNYKAQSVKSLKKLREYFIDNAKQKISIYVPSRAFNALYLIRDSIDFSKIDFIDDNEMLQGTFIPGFDIAIKSRDALYDNIPERVLIMSNSFEEAIKINIDKSALHGVKIDTISEILKESL